MLQITCPKCSKNLKAPDHAAGRAITCPRCGNRLLISAGGEEPSTPRAAGISSSPPPTAPAAPEWTAPPNQEFEVRSSVGHRPRPGHSGLGIASFLIAVLVGGLYVILLIVVVIGLARSGRHTEPSLHKAQLATEMFAGVSALV